MSIKGKDYRGKKDLTIGLRNNNPLNLRPSYANGKPEKWQGMTNHNVGGFMQFSNTIFGLRAATIDIAGDIKKGKNTLRKLISEFAPSSENNTAAYIANVSKSTGFAPDEILTPNEDTLTRIIKAKLVVENGSSVLNFVSSSDVQQGVYYGLNRNITFKPMSASASGGEAAIAFGIVFFFFIIFYKFILA